MPINRTKLFALHLMKLLSSTWGFSKKFPLLCHVKRIYYMETDSLHATLKANGEKLRGDIFGKKNRFEVIFV